MPPLSKLSLGDVVILDIKRDSRGWVEVWQVAPEGYKCIYDSYNASPVRSHRGDVRGSLDKYIAILCGFSEVSQTICPFEELKEHLVEILI